MEQLIANVFIAASVYTLCGIGFAVIYRTTRFFHFAHASVISFAAYLAYLSISEFHIHVIPAVLLCVAGGTALGCLIDASVYRPLRVRQAGPLILLLASLGVYIAIHNLLALSFGDDFKSVRLGAVREGILVAGARVTCTQFAILFAAVAAVVGTSIFMTHTRAGLQLRAVASDSVLATASGVPVNKAVLLAFAIGSALGSFAGFLLAIDSGVNPQMGLNFLLMGVVAVIVGGAKRIAGIVVGALLVAGTQQIAAWHMGAQWQDCAAFVVLVVFLLIRGRELVTAR